jgi:hypothetical protein
MEVDRAPGTQAIFPGDGVFDAGGVIAAHVEDRLAQSVHQVLKIIISQVTAAQDEIYIGEALCHGRRINEFQFLVA